MHRPQLEQRQLDALNELLAEILPANRFYAERLKSVTLPLTSLEQLQALPLTTKAEWVAAGQHRPPLNLTYPLAVYTRVHQTSGTQGEPLRVYDTADDWSWWIQTWQHVLDAAEVTAADTALMAFSFGPFIGFWSAYDALAARGCLVIPTGGMSTVQRLHALLSYEASVVCCTPTYAMRMVEVAREQGIELANTPVQTLIVAGESGGSVPAIRDRVEAAWGARVIDHAGATEVGPWGFADPSRRGLHVAEDQFIAEFLPTTHPEFQELVLTALGRKGWPVIRYRTGDLVRPRFDGASAHGFVFLEGGVIGRVDEMVVVRGVNVYPSAIEAIIRGFGEVDEYRATVRRDGEMDGLQIEVEMDGARREELAEHFQQRLGLRVTLAVVKPGELPRFEAKSRRFFDRRATPSSKS